MARTSVDDDAAGLRNDDPPWRVREDHKLVACFGSHGKPTHCVDRG